MNKTLCRALLALSIAAGVSVSATAASFHIQGVEPVAAVRGVSPPAMTAHFTVTAPGTTPDWTASLEGSPAWASLSTAGGAGPGSLTITFNAAALAAGSYNSALILNSGGTLSRQNFSLTIIKPNVVKMEADYNRPAIYALHRGTQATNPPGYLIIYNTGTEQVEKVIPAGTNPTDLDISYAEDKIYVSNHGVAPGSIRVIDPAAMREIRAMNGGPDVYQINAGKAGRLITEGFNQWINAEIRNSGTGASLNSLYLRQGDGESDPSGRYYYHCDTDISSARVTRYDVQADTFAAGPAGIVHDNSERNLVMSGDGSRIFWNSYAYDSQLNELRSFGTEIYASTLRGEIVFSHNGAYDGMTGAQLASLPVTTTVMAVSGDQQKLILFNSATGAFSKVPLSAIGTAPSPLSTPVPAANAVIPAPLSQLQWSSAAGALRYQVYFGTDSAAVAAATAASPLYLGETTELQVPLAATLVPGTTYYWRVDPTGFRGTNTGSVWQFTVSGMAVTPHSLSIKIPRGAAPRPVLLSTSAAAPGTWTAAESLDWLTLSATAGNTGDPVTATLNPGTMAAGIYQGTVQFIHNGQAAALPVSLEIFDLELMKLIPDPARPWVYGLHPGTSLKPGSYVICINTATRQIENVIEAGAGATDFTINYQEGRLYVNNWQRPFIQVIDLASQSLLAPIPSSREVYKLSAGKAGRIYSEGVDNWVPGTIINSTTGAKIAIIESLREGDGELDPSGRYYYHCDNNTSIARITRYDVQADSYVRTVTSPEHPSGSRHLIMSGDGSRLFWQGYAFDAALNELKSYDTQIYAATFRGEVVFSDSKALDGATGAQLAVLPVKTAVSAVSGDQSGLFYYNPATKTVGFMAMSTVAPVALPGISSHPPHNTVQLTPLAGLSWDTAAATVKYRVYFGTDAAAVAAATTASSEYAGETVETFWPLAAASVPAGGTFYWRVDYAGLTGTTAGSVKSFQTLPVSVAPAAVDSRSIRGAPAQKIRLPVSGIDGIAWTATTSGAAWLRVVTPSGNTGDTLELELTPGILATGNYAGSVTLTAGAESVAIPVKFGIEAPGYMALKSDPARPRLYALQRPASLTGSLVVINTATSAVERVIPLSDNPSDFDLTADNQFLYVVTQGGRKMHRIHLEDWSTAEKPLPATPDENHPAVRYRVAAGAGTKVYWVDGQSAPTLHSMDFATGLETGPPIVPEGTGFGAIARAGDGSSLAAWAQFGWSAGSYGSKALVVDTSGASAVPGARGVLLERDPLDTPVITRSGSSSVFMKKYRLSADLSTVEVEYPADVYAATGTPGIVFGAWEAWKERTLTKVWQAPEGVTANICAVSGDQSAFFYFNTATGTLVRVAMSSLGDIPGPGPENGEIVSAMPEELSWTPKPQALRYEVYFGTDQAGVQSATGTNSPFHLGTATQARLPFHVPFQTAGVWWWRVDTVLPGSTVKGSVWKFSGALKFLNTLSGATSHNFNIIPPLAMEGPVIMSGYPEFSQDSTTFPGVVYVHRKRTGSEEWYLHQKISRPPTAAASARFGSAVAIKGDIAWIGARLASTGGRAYEYRMDSVTGMWAATGRSITPPVPASGDQFGSTLAFDGSVLAVGATGATVGTVNQAGAVDLFDPRTLTRIIRITEATPTSEIRFGSIMALGDGFLAVASPNRSSAPDGAVDIWTRSGISWARTGTLVAPAGPALYDFGASLAVSGNRLVVGTRGPAGLTGQVFVFEKGPGGTWNQVSRIETAGPLRTDYYGSSLAANGGLIAMGTPTENPTLGLSRSPVWLHRNTGGQTWTAVAPAVPDDLGSYSQFASNMAITSRYLAVAYNGGPPGGITVFLHNPAGNLPPSFTSSPVLFAETDSAYTYRLRAADENAGDRPVIRPAAALPAWLSVQDHGDGTATLSGTPPPDATGDFAVSLDAVDEAGDSARQSFTLRVLAPGTLPRITSGSGAQTINDGQPVTFSVTVAPGASPSYQWYGDGIPLSGQTGASLVLNNVQSSDAGDYQVRITRSGVWVDSDPMKLTVNQVPDRFGGDWPSFGAGNSHSGAYPATLARHRFLPAWTVADVGPNQVATSSGRVFTTGYVFPSPSATVSARSLHTGERLWSTNIPAGSSINPPTYHRGKVYMQRGKADIESPDLRCFDAATGALQWKVDYAAQWDSHFAPAVDDTGVYINGGGYGGIYRFGLDGTGGFFLGLEQHDNWTPLLHQGGVYSWVAGNFRRHDPVSGQVLYRVTIPWIGSNMHTVAAAEGNTAVMLSTADLISIDLTTRRVLWKKAQAWTGSPAIRGGVVYAIREGGVESFDAVTGTAGTVYPILTTSGQNASGIHQPVLLDDTLIVSSMEETWTFNLATGALLQRLPGGGPLTYTDGYLLAAGSDSTLRAWKVNQPANITPPAPELAATEDIPFQWDIAVTDPDEDTLTASVSGLPPWLTPSPLQQGIIRLSGTPLNQHAGSFTLTITANDAQSFVSTTAINGSVLAVNDRPTAAAPAPFTVDEDSVIPALPLSTVFSDEEHGFSGLSLTIMENSSPALFTQAAISSGQLRLTLTPDAHGSAVLKIAATDSGGLSVETTLTVTVQPVADAPRITADPVAPVIPAEGTAFTYAAGPLFSDPDPGEVTAWTIASVDRPELFRSLTIEPGTGLLSADWTPYVWGSATVIIRATGLDGLSAETPVVLSLAAPPAPEWTLSGNAVLNRQTGLVEQRVAVKNTGIRAIAGFSLSVLGSGDTVLYNGMPTLTGSPSRTAGSGILPYALPLGAGAEITLVMEFYSPSRLTGFSLTGSSPLDPLEPALPLPPASEAAFGITRALPVTGGMMIEFPSEPGAHYRVEYSADNSTWTACPLPIQGGGTCVQWIDRGPPFTLRSPQEVPQRFYRIRKL